MADVDLEFGAEGPRLKFSLLRKDATQDGLSRFIRTVAADLGIVRQATLLAPKGVPAADSLEPSGLEVGIRTAHQLWVDQVERAAQAKIDQLGAELETLGVDVTDSEFPSIESTLSGRLGNIVNGVAADLPAATQRMIDTTAELNAFNIRNGTANEPTTRSLAVWSATAVGTVIGEAFVNSPMFAPDLGWMGGASTAGAIGAGVTILGILSGIAAAQMKRPDAWRKVAGALGLSAMIMVAALYLLGATHYRVALHAEAANVPAQIASQLKASPLRPLADFTVLPYMLVNIACLLLVAWKSIPMFGFGDLKRLKAAAEAAAQGHRSCLDSAYGACDAAGGVCLRDADEIIDKACRNAARGSQLVKAAGLVERVYRQQVARLSDSKIGCERLYREVVEGCHPAGRHQARFRVEPQAIRPADLLVDRGLASVAGGLQARSVALRGALPKVTEGIDRQVIDAKGKIQQMALDIEARLRSGASDVANILQFKR